MHVLRIALSIALSLGVGLGAGASLGPRADRKMVAAGVTPSYRNTTFIGSHDSPFTGPLPTQNQNLNVTSQLDLGIRFLQGQTHLNPTNDKELRLCHSSCFLEDAGTLLDFLGLVNGWLDVEENKNEVVTLLLTNGDNVDVSLFAQAFEESGLDKVAFVPSAENEDDGEGDDWPSIEKMARDGTRLVVFLGMSPSRLCVKRNPNRIDYNANMTQTPYILDEFTYFFETPFDVTDASFSNCSIDRPPGAKPDNRMSIVNHFLDVDLLGVKVPDRAHADKTNAINGESGIITQAKRCVGLYDRVPNVILLDFVDRGETMQAERVLRQGF